MGLVMAQKKVTLDLVVRMDVLGKKIDAIQVANAYRDATGEYIDWHEFSYYLDELERKGILRITQGGGFTQYAVARG